MAYFPGHKCLVEGMLVKTDGRIWLVGLVNASRARLDPVTVGHTVVADPVSGRVFQSFGSSINVSPYSSLEEVDMDALSDVELSRLVHLQERAEKDAAAQTAREVETEERRVHQEINMAEAQNAVNGSVSGAPIPVKSKAEQNRERLAQIARNRAADKAKREAARQDVAAKKAVAPKAPKAPKEPKPCECGCGAMTGSYFVPGHDARFKGWLRRIAKGEKRESVMPAAVVAKYQWRKSGDGYVPTKDYKGAPYGEA